MARYRRRVGLFHHIPAAGSQQQTQQPEGKRLKRAVTFQPRPHGLKGAQPEERTPVAPDIVLEAPGAPDAVMVKSVVDYRHPLRLRDGNAREIEVVHPQLLLEPYPPLGEVRPPDELVPRICARIGEKEIGSVDAGKHIRHRSKPLRWIRCIRHRADRVVPVRASEDDVAFQPDSPAVHPLQHRPAAPVVRVAEEHVVTGRLAKPAVPGRAGSRIGLRQHLDTTVSRRDVAKNPERTISRAVVHANNLDVPQRLAEDGTKAFTKIPLDVVDWDNDGHFGRCYSHHLSFLPAIFAARHDNRAETVERTDGFGRRRKALTARRSAFMTFARASSSRSDITERTASSRCSDGMRSAHVVNWRAIMAM